MAPSTPVTMFNGNTTAVNVVVNNGTSFQIGATSASIGFRPQLPANEPGFNAGPVTSGNFGIGKNCISITPVSFTSPIFFSFTIPGDIQMVSLQAYVFWSNDSGFGIAYFLNNGQVFAIAPGSSSCA